MPRPPLTELNPERIAIIKPSALGDIVHALPVLTALRRRFPAAHITWIVNRSYEPLLEGHPDLDATLTFDRGALKRGVVSTAMTAVRFANKLRSGKFDLAIDLQGLFRSGLMTFATGAARRVGLSTAREGASHFYTDVIPTPGLDEAHAVDRCWRAAEAFGAADEPRTFHVPIAPDAQQWVAEQLAGCERPWLVFAVGARWLTKRWPPEHFAAIARAAQDRAGGTAIFIGTSDETALADDTVHSLNGPAVNLSGQTNLKQLVAVLAAADFLAANDSGPLHIAAALGRPLVAPYTCTEIRLHGPYGARRRGDDGRLPWLVHPHLRPLIVHGGVDAGSFDGSARRGARRMAVALPFRLILASGSPARRELLTRHGYSFEVRPAAIVEPLDAGHGDPRSYVQQIAWMKAAAVAAQFDDGVVLAADTVGWCDGKPVLKPNDEADAYRILRMLAGRRHELWTGVCLWRKPDGVQIAWQEFSRVSMKPMSDSEISTYLQTRQWEGCSGAYAIQEENDPLLTVEGSISNVIGLPMESLERHLSLFV